MTPLDSQEERNRVRKYNGKPSLGSRSGRSKVTQTWVQECLCPPEGSGGSSLRRCQILCKSILFLLVLFVFSLFVFGFLFLIFVLPFGCRWSSSGSRWWASSSLFVMRITSWVSCISWLSSSCFYPLSWTCAGHDVASHCHEVTLTRSSPRLP